MKVALYARVSRQEQDPESQLLPLREYLTARGWKEAGEYVDRGISGARDSRPELDRLLNDARKKKFDAILVWKLDRFGRSLRHLVLTVHDLLERGVGFISYQDNLDLTTSVGRLTFHLLAAFAEFERDMIRERVNAGLDRVRKEGKRLGRPGTRIDPAEASRVFKECRSYRGTAKRLGVPRSSVRRVLQEIGRDEIVPLERGVSKTSP